MPKYSREKRKVQIEIGCLYEDILSHLFDQIGTNYMRRQSQATVDDYRQDLTKRTFTEQVKVACLSASKFESIYSDYIGGDTR